MNRRAFVKTIVGVSGASLLQACGLQPDEILASPTPPPKAIPNDMPPIPTVEPTPQPTADPRVQVALIRTDDRASGIHQAVDLLELQTFPGKRLFLKPNLNSADPPPGSSHTDAIAALIRKLSDAGADRITLGDRSGMGNTRAVMQAKGIFTMADEYHFDTIVFDELDRDQWSMVEPEQSHWAGGFAIAAPLLSHDGIVQLCCLKTHRFGGHFTLSLKNSVGMVAKRVPGEGHDYMNELHNSMHQRRMIAEINQAYTPDLVVLDGLEAFLDGGPDRGTRAQPGVILASADRIALDAVGVAILRYFGTTEAVRRGPIFQQEQIARAAELGVGIKAPDKIELVTTDAQGAEFAAAINDHLLADGA